MPDRAALFLTAEGRRMLAIARGEGWRRWGPYLSERQWGTVREDYSPAGTAWDYLPHDHARSRAYRWGEDGLAGFADEHLHWCLGIALWNGQDPILKERLFGLTNDEGNHGEDVKEHYTYIDSVPTHSYNRMSYRYPQSAYPYAELVEENARRGKAEPEYEIYDTGVFAGDRYFDVTVEYAKADTDDILMRVTAKNLGDEAAPLHILPQLWGRNTWSWSANGTRARITPLPAGGLLAVRHGFTDMRLDFDGDEPAMFCENDTNVQRLYGEAASGPFKDGFHEAVIQGAHSAMSFNGGSKMAFHRRVDLAPRETHVLRLRLRPNAAGLVSAFARFDDIFAARKEEADEFHAALAPALADPEARHILRRAYAGLLWSKQFYAIDIPRWLAGDPLQPAPPPARKRNAAWTHLNNADVISMPDTWEYPWYAAWDLAFQCVALAGIDPDFAKSQLSLLTREWYMHPNGQLPAYEWAFDDVNPPVHAWAALRVFYTDAVLTGQKDRAFLERIFHKLLLNFTWWVNRVDREGRNIFQGGFLGLDNIGIFDRSHNLPTGGVIDQADGTAWMAMYALNMMRIALELALDNPVYENLASKFFEHFLAIADAMTDIGGHGMGLWNNEDEFYYDVLALPDGTHVPLKLRSVVGLIPLFAVEVLDKDIFDRLPAFAARTRWFLANRPQQAKLVSRWSEPGKGDRHLLSLLRGHRLKCLLRRALDETEFLSQFGLRSLSKAHSEPYHLHVGGSCYEINYQPGESQTDTFGGNSNWRGPVWFPINFLLVDSLRAFHTYYGEDFRVECPVGSGTSLNLHEVADELVRRLAALFRRGPDGSAPFCGSGPGACMNGEDIMFHEYFHGDTGKGLGASHQTGWTGLIAVLLSQ
jgi:hypothetical protein